MWLGGCGREGVDGKMWMGRWEGGGMGRARKIFSTGIGIMRVVGLVGVVAGVEIEKGSLFLGVGGGGGKV